MTFRTKDPSSVPTTLRTLNVHPFHMKYSLPLLLALPLLGAAPLLHAQSIDVGGTVTAVNANTLADPLAFVAGTYYYPYTGVSTSSGTATAINGFASLAAVAPGDFTFAYDNLDLTGYSSAHPGPGNSIETYTPGAGSDFTFFVSGVPIATGEVVSFIVTTDYNTGLATAVGSLHLSAPGANPAFFNEVSALTGGSNLVDFSAPNLFFDLAPSLASGTFNAAGTFSVTPVPEPSSLALGFGVSALLVAAIRRRRRT